MRLTYLLIAASFLSLSTTALASNNEQAIIEKVVAAYGGKSLTSMKSLIVRDRYKSIAENGGIRPGLDAVSRLHSTLTVDYGQNRKSVKNWSVSARGKRLTQIMYDGVNGWSINHLRGSHVIRNDLNQNNVGAGMMRLLDTTVVRSLLDARDTATYQGQESFLGKMHEKLSFKINGTTQVTIFIDSKTGLVSKLTRPNGTHYLYSGHRKRNGVAYASDTNQLNQGKAAVVTLSRTIEINPDVSDAFVLPETTKALKGMRDNSKMVVREIGNDTYLAGLGNRSSLFVDGGDHFVAVGSLNGFEKRLQAVNEKLGTNKPVKYLVVPEHQGHFGDIDKIAAMGTDFVTVANHLPLLNSRFKQPLPAERFLKVNEKLELANGKVHVYDISLITSEQFLLFYVPKEKLVFSLDEFGTNLLDSVPSADKRMLSFRKAIEGLGIDAQQFAYVHGTGILSMAQLQQVTDSYIDGYCPEGHTICLD